MTKVENMKLYIKTFLKLGVSFIFLAVAFSACAESPAKETQPGNTQVAKSSTPARVTETTPTANRQPETASAPAVNLTPEIQATSSAPITRQEVVVMFDSVENFTSVIDRLDGLSDDEKQVLVDYITQELQLNGEIQQNCTASLTDEERSALHDMDMGSPLYQQANDKFNYAITYTPACSQPFQQINALMTQHGDLIIKVKSLVSAYMTP
ncbi:MAG: hypothetical protein GX457_16445 [Thermotogaceae bacterium]|nr:hypothetical protein [Thermotogaceae bacterium]